jgi:uncharacterized protein (TIGR02001 family)
MQVYLVGAALLLSTAQAEVTAGGSVAINSDYIWRGVSQSDGRAVLQADLHVTPLENWTIGLWASPVRLQPTQPTLELNVYSQWRVAVGGNASATLGAVYYSYPNNPRPTAYNYLEITAAFDWRDQLAVNVGFAPSVTLYSSSFGLALNRQTWSIEFSARHPLPMKLLGQIGLGHFNAVGLAHSGYAYGSAGLMRDFGRLHAELGYYLVSGEAQRSYSPGSAGGPWAATLAWRF